jgi:hypothetical protein
MQGDMCLPKEHQSSASFRSKALLLRTFQLWNWIDDRFLPLEGEAVRNEKVKLLSTAEEALN